ncbi:hypothetical protein [Arthrobacter sp. AD-310]
METITAMILVFAAAFAWIGLTVYVLLHLRRRRNGSTLVATAPGHDGHVRGRPQLPWRHHHPAANRTRARRKLHLRKVRG